MWHRLLSVLPCLIKSVRFHESAAKPHSDYCEYAMEQLERGEPEKSPAVKARIRNIRKALHELYRGGDNVKSMRSGVSFDPIWWDVRAGKCSIAPVSRITNRAGSLQRFFPKKTGCQNWVKNYATKAFVS